MIIGPGGSGKSTLARAIAARTGLPVVHLDVLFWRADWEPAPVEQAVRDLAAAVADDRWIVDGNFLQRVGEDGRLDRADTVIFLDLPRRVCLWRVIVRLVRDRRRTRPDLPEGCREGFDPDGLRWIWNYPATERPSVLKLLAGAAERGAVVHHLRCRADVRRFIAGRGR